MLVINGAQLKIYYVISCNNKYYCTIKEKGD